MYYTNTEVKIMAICSLLGTWLIFAVGGIDNQLTALIILVVADYFTGIFAALKLNQLSSQVGYKGILKKLTMFIAIAFANLVDTGLNVHILRSLAICGFVGVEATSVLENVDRLGYGHIIPNSIRDKLIQIRTEKGVKI